ncbi:MAG: HAD family hydrolase, partial [Eubacteriales bacterium]|nr:HAD family hydrolase [Eubacteriales bacterium]
MINTVLFDLDGTLLPLDQELFVKRYFGALARCGAAATGREAAAFIDGVWAGTGAMLFNDGNATNRDRFWDSFCARMGGGVSAEALEPLFERFYETEFEAAREAAQKNEAARKSVDLLKEKGYTVALATNPLFPPVAVKKRLSWAGLDYADFAHVTTYDNSRFCKPNPGYFKDILALLQKEPSECLMVGNDAADDMGAREAGLSVFLVTDCLVNEKGLPIEGFRQGSLTEFYGYVKEL